MITDNDEQIKEFTIWSPQQQDLIEDATQSIRDSVKHFKCDKIYIAKFLALSSIQVGKRLNNTLEKPTLIYIGNDTISFESPNHSFGIGDKYDVTDPLKLKQFFLKIIAEYIANGRMNPRTDLMYFDIMR